MRTPTISNGASRWRVEESTSACADAAGGVGGRPGGIGAGCAGAASAGLASPVGGGCSSGLTASSSLTSDINLKVVPQNGAAEGGREAIDCSFAAPQDLSSTGFAEPLPASHLRALPNPFLLGTRVICGAERGSLALFRPALVWWCGGEREPRCVAAAAAESVLCGGASRDGERAPRHRVGGGGLLSPVAERERVAAAALSLSLTMPPDPLLLIRKAKAERETVPFVLFD